MATGGWELDVVRRPPGVRGWGQQPKRWIVERTFAWLLRNRRLVVDCERKVQTSETLIEVAICACWWLAGDGRRNDTPNTLSGREDKRHTFDVGGRAPVAPTRSRIQGGQEIIAADAEEMNGVAIGEVGRSDKDHAVSFHRLIVQRRGAVTPHDVAIARTERIGVPSAHVEHQPGDAHT